MIRLAAVLTCLWASQGAAQQYCADRDHVVSKLKSGYGEQISGGGLYSENQVFEIWFSPASGSWTILQTRSDGSACVMATGSNWRQFQIKKPIPGEEG